MDVFSIFLIQEVQYLPLTGTEEKTDYWHHKTIEAAFVKMKVGFNHYMKKAYLKQII